MSTFYDKLDSETRDVINYLKNRNEICDLRIEEYPAAHINQLHEWEIRSLCDLPEDLKAFYLNHNGMLIEWKFKLDSNTEIPLGRIQINNLKDLTKVGSVLSKDFGEPSVYDLEDLQTPPKQLINSLSKTTKSINLQKIKRNHSEKPSDLTSNDKIDDLNDIESTDDEFNYDKEFVNSIDLNNHKSNTKSKQIDYGFLPHFDESSRNFEIDNCNGFGKVCLVYRNSKAGCTSSEHSAEIWYLDRSLEWHFLTNSFKNYYLMLIAHLGLPQWQTLFTEDGLPPFLYQWYYMFVPGRILIHDDCWKKLDFLNVFENSNNNSNNNNSLIRKPNQAQHHHHHHQQQQNPQRINSVSTNKIDFNKLFDDKQQSKTKPQTTTITNSVNSPSSALNDKNGSLLKARSKLSIRNSTK